MPLQQTDTQRTAALQAAGVSAASLPQPIAVAPLANPVQPLNVAATTPAPLPTLPAATPGVTATPTAATTPFTSELERLQSQISGKNLDSAATRANATAPYEQQLNQINTQLAQRQAQAIANQEKVMASGGDTSFQSGESQRVARTDAIEVLKLSALQAGIQGNITLAEKQAQASLDAKYGQVEQDIETAKTNIYRNYERFTKDEKKRADATLLRLDKDDAFVKEQKENDKAIFSLASSAFQYGASPELVQKIQAAGSPEEALSIAGPTLGEPFRQQVAQQKFENEIARSNLAINQAQLRLSQNKSKFENQQRYADIANGVLTEAQIKAIDTSPQGKSLKSLGDLKLKADAYKALVTQYGTASFGKQKSILSASFADLKIAYKTAAELGALQGPDIVLLEEALRPATFANPFTQGFAKLIGGGVGTIDASITQAIKTVSAAAETNYTQLVARNPAYGNSDYVQALALPFAKPDEGLVDVGGQKVPAGSIIENNQGKRARVNPDGTVTPL